ncbi:MAG: hypothetical protein HN341_04935 [Verrucomicrobia bacterium]|nr:hypothetical protein [Verrucomicrobiota bacterium]
MSVVCLVLLLSGCYAHAKASDNAWHELKGKHFIIAFKSDSVDSSEVLRHAEAYYSSIVKLLGFRRLDNFWLWERRARIKLYASHQEFIRETGAPSWAVAKANFRHRTIEAFGSSALFLESRLPHEMAHLIFREYTGFDGAIPLWLDEGVAQWCERAGSRRPRKPLREWIPLRTLTRMDVHASRDARLVRLFYDEAASLVQFLVEVHGRDRFARFCRQLRDGKTLDGALRFTYPKTLSTMEQLEQQWSAWQLAGGS